MDPQMLVVTHVSIILQEQVSSITNLNGSAPMTLVVIGHESLRESDSTKLSFSLEC